MKILVAEDAAGKVWISYDSPQFLADHHGLQPELIRNLAVIEALATAAAN